MSPKDELHQQQ